ncbi:MAG: hypothetical protein A2V98_22130 [Planctomycetes bacterium RBG_16_64_12]|nr:MAG: hypothetical protein A2V98_22130 [Planctomycetes bacterium RBG_16_64_12]
MNSVPVVGRADHHRVDVLALEQIAVVAIDGGPGHCLGRVFEPFLVDVAHGDALGLTLAAQRPQFVVQRTGSPPHADVTDEDPLVGPLLSRRGKGRRRDHLRGPEGRTRHGRRFQKRAAGHSSVVFCHLACLSMCSRPGKYESQQSTAKDRGRHFHP